MKFAELADQERIVGAPALSLDATGVFCTLQNGLVVRFTPVSPSDTSVGFVLAWTNENVGTGPLTAPTYSPGAGFPAFVTFLDADGNLVAVSAKTGNKLWSQTSVTEDALTTASPNDVQHEAPVVSSDGSTIFVASASQVTAHGANNGERAWTQQLTGQGWQWAPPVVSPSARSPPSVPTLFTIASSIASTGGLVPSAAITQDGTLLPYITVPPAQALAISPDGWTLYAVIPGQDDTGDGLYALALDN